MTAKELIKKLSVLSETEKNLPIRLLTDTKIDEENIWLTNIEISKKKERGYEVDGEIRLIGAE